MSREIRWPTVALVAAVVAGVVAIFAFAGPAERVEYLSILSVLGTSLAAVMRAAFGAPKATPKRVEPRCEECWMMPWRGHMESCSRYTGALPLASDPPVVGDKISARVDIADAWSDAVVTKVHSVAEKTWGPDMPSAPASTRVTAELAYGGSVCAEWPSPLLAKNGAAADDDDPGEGGEALAEEPPTKPLPRASRRVTLSPRAAVKESLTARLGLALACLVLSACSPSALQTHATIASATGHVFDAACSEVERARSVEQHAIADGPLDRDESRVAVDAVRARWAPALASCELAADTHDAWVTTLALAAAGAPFALTDGLVLARQALSVWQSLAATLMIAGVRMPAVPAELVALVGGGL